MRTFFFLAALALGVGSAACGAAPAPSGPTQEEIKAEAEKLDTSATPNATTGTTAVKAGCGNWAACYRVCLHRDPKGNSGCEDWCDWEYPQCGY